MTISVTLEIEYPSNWDEFELVCNVHKPNELVVISCQVMNIPSSVDPVTGISDLTLSSVVDYKWITKGLVCDSIEDLTLTRSVGDGLDALLRACTSLKRLTFRHLNVANNVLPLLKYFPGKHIVFDYCDMCSTILHQWPEDLRVDSVNMCGIHPIDGHALQLEKLFVSQTTSNIGVFDTHFESCELMELCLRFPSVVVRTGA